VTRLCAGRFGIFLGRPWALRLGYFKKNIGCRVIFKIKFFFLGINKNGRAADAFYLLQYI
jgi:hypothetical protein